MRARSVGLAAMWSSLSEIISSAPRHSHAWLSPRSRRFVRVEGNGMGWGLKCWVRDKTRDALQCLAVLRCGQGERAEATSEGASSR
eukprot:6343788-Prymnesium_polylepis.2